MRAAMSEPGMKFYPYGYGMPSDPFVGYFTPPDLESRLRTYMMGGVSAAELEKKHAEKLRQAQDALANYFEKRRAEQENRELRKLFATPTI